MTSILFDRQRQGSTSPPLQMLKDALSKETMNLAEAIRTFLHSDPSPGSLLQEQPIAGLMQTSTTRTARVSVEPSLHERLFDALAEVKIMTSKVAMHLDKQWRQKLFAQLDSLHDPDEWEEGEEPLQQESFATFLKAMLAINPERRPGLGLSSLGHLIAAWTTGSDRLTIEFLPGDRTRWVLARAVSGETDRFAGDTPVSRLVEGLAPYRPDYWLRYAEQQDHQPA